MNLEQHIGTTLKKIRISHGYTQAYVSKNIISRTYLSLIESNKYSVSINILLDLLDRLNIELDEFIFLILKENNEKQLFKFRSINDYSEKQQKELLKTLKEKYSDKKGLKYKHLILTLEAHQHFKKHANLNVIQELTLPIKTYLKNLNSWLIYDFKLFNNTMFCFTIEEIIDMMPMILEYNKKYEYFFHEKSSILNFLCNLCILLVTNHKYAEALEYIEFGKVNTTEPLQLYHRLFLDCIGYYCVFKIKEDKADLENLNQKISLAKQLNCNELVLFFEKLPIDTCVS